MSEQKKLIILINITNVVANHSFSKTVAATYCDDEKYQSIENVFAFNTKASIDEIIEFINLNKPYTFNYSMFDLSCGTNTIHIDSSFINRNSEFAKLIEENNKSNPNYLDRESDFDKELSKGINDLDGKSTSLSLTDQMDIILDKILNDGIESLTKDDREFFEKYNKEMK